MSFKKQASLFAGLKPGVNAINGADDEKFPLILNRIATSLINKTAEFCPFSEDEEEKLSDALSISLNDVRALLESSAFILKEAAFNVTKPAVLRQQLIEDYGLDEDKADVFVLTWTTHAKNIIGALKQRSLFPSQVEAVSWMLTTRVSASEEGEENVMRPAAVIDLQLGPSPSAVTSDSSKSLLRFDLDQSQLSRLYLTLEEVQAKLDGLR